MNFDMDFGAVPPEINSGRMYAGPGSGPLLAAATGWDQLARELSTSAAAYRSVVAGLSTDSWRGPSSATMAGAAGRYVDWLHATAGQAEQTAVQVRAAATAYQTAWAATVSPPLIAANRLRLTTLVATNFFGQNSPAIAATEADYERMWAQDAVAMHSYAASASSASTLAPFTAAPTVTAPAPAAALDPSTLLSIALDVPSLTSAAASTTSSSFSGLSIHTTNHALAVNAMRDEHQGIGPFLAGTAGPVAAALTGRASLAGALSVPPGWAAVEAAPTPNRAVLASTGSPMTAPAMASPLPPGVFGEAMLGTLAGRGANTAAAKLRRPSVIPRSPAAG
ncbi:PPE family protein [[Mycobacterium] vasticus]|uniref:PPE family protein n=1 Tax=[Mycobacterium] vasticus TaxID=2875777 RepID=A0ABU5YYN0_9MYCO|nr:PPE family protein [Mycolicibacter sp. MYC017]MEB3070253.1 PPE family protein [Mycolicibacter sp. MYC017]